MSADSPIYLDHAATTPLDARVWEAMQAANQAGYANPASQHTAGRSARRALEQSRDEITRLLGGETTGMDADRLIFTSGGTEANQLALLGGVGEPGGRVLISAIEHPSVRGAGEELQRRGYVVDTIPVDESGMVEIPRLVQLLATKPAPKLVSIMVANNEVGVVQPLQEIAQLCHSHHVPIHADAAQAIGKLPFGFRDGDLDAITIAPHKLGGPIGIGGLLTRGKFPMNPLFHGGFQQAGLRPGTESFLLASGFAAAVRFAMQELQERMRQLTEARDCFEARLQARIPNLHVNAGERPRTPHISNVAFLGVDRQQLLLALDRAGVYCSTGSACASGSSEPSGVLLAMGLKPALVASSLRFSFSPRTTLAEVESAVERISLCVNKLRRE